MNEDSPEQLIYLFSKLPGLGTRSARRIVLHLLQDKELRLRSLIDGLTDAATNAYNKDIKANLLYVKKVDVDKSEFILRYDPNHPAANADGYVKYPNIIAEIERADAQEAQRSIEANLGVIEISNSLIQKTIEAIK